MAEIKSTGRTFLTGAAVGVSTASLSAAATALSDPIFAAIDRHRTAEAEWSRLSLIENELPRAAPELDAVKTALLEATNAEQDALQSLRNDDSDHAARNVGNARLPARAADGIRRRP
jgi:hypothetical protein